MRAGFFIGFAGSRAVGPTAARFQEVMGLAPMAVASCALPALRVAPPHPLRCVGDAAEAASDLLLLPLDAG